jgi:uncharacterized protein YodC (DUF2158 family)
MAAQFKIGDTVQLKSGGPIMTVTQVGTPQFGVLSVWTTWFDDNFKEFKGVYPVDAVVPKA